MPIPGLVPVLPPLPSSASQRPNISILGGDGTFWDLTNLDGQVILMPGFTGFDAPPVTTFTAGTPGLAGAGYLGSHDEPRPLFIPVYTEGASRIDAVELRRALLSSIHWTKGLSTVCVAEPDGHRRYLDCVYTGGMEGDEGTDVSGLSWTTYGITMTAFDNPYWYGDVVNSSPWVPDAPRSFFPLAPMVFTLSSSSVIGGTLVDNIGEVDAYPTWVLSGPSTGLTLTLGSRVFSTTSALLTGESLTINTDPRSQTITDNTGANRWADVVPGSIDLWSIPPGVSSVMIAVSGSGAATQLAMSYRPRFLKS